MDAIGWEPRTSLSSETKSFEQAFGFAPRPLQQAVTDALITCSPRAWGWTVEMKLVVDVPEVFPTRK